MDQLYHNLVSGSNYFGVSGDEGKMIYFNIISTAALLASDYSTTDPDDIEDFAQLESFDKLTETVIDGFSSGIVDDWASEEYSPYHGARAIDLQAKQNGGRGYLS